MKDQEVKIKEIETSNTLGGAGEGCVQMRVNCRVYPIGTGRVTVSRTISVVIYTKALYRYMGLTVVSVQTDQRSVPLGQSRG